MPWHGVDPVDVRLEFVQAFRAGLWSMTELCERFDVSRKTGYKLVARFEADGRAGLSERSRRPLHCPTATEPALIERLCACRRQHPTWSARKLLVVLRRQEPRLPWPARSTAAALLKARGLVRQRRRQQRHRAGPSGLAAMTAPNAVWTTDFKGEFRTGDGQYCFPLTLRDGFSRYVLRCDALLTKRSPVVRVCFERAFRTYGLPDRIRSDNGGPFAATGVTRLSRLSAWWIRLGIYPERIALGHPEQNGSHEQFHRILKAETTRPPARHAAAQQTRFHRFCAEYNQARPHEALHDQCPGQWYTPSSRPLPTRLPPLEYPGHMETRRVKSTGHIAWRGGSVFLTQALGGEDVALDEINDGVWVLYFARVQLARFDARTRRLSPLPHRQQ